MICKNDAFMRMVGTEKLDKRVEVDFDVQHYLPDCRKINARKYYSTAATSVTYDAYAVPANKFECMNFGCVNSGTAYIGTSKTVYKTVGSEDFIAGLINISAGSSTSRSVSMTRNMRS